MASGPTQNYQDATLGTWRPRPWLSHTVRVMVVAVPMLLALAVGLAAVQWVPPQRIGMNPWLWLLLQVALSTLILLGVGRLTRLLLPLSALLRMSLVFPDRAPSRFAVARRTHSPQRLAESVAGHHGAEEDHDHAQVVLDLVAALSAHDRVTFRHSERVQAYAAMIGVEMGLSADDAAKLGWAALLHDVGKLHVPTEVLCSPGRPTPNQWAVLTTHPHEGMQLAGPLARWLGPWLDAIGQHHERWDGGGYPAGLAGTNIGLGARIVAVADAYDVITTSRSYKEPLSAAAAREELARCAGTQFDPDVVHAFLRVGLGRLRLVAGPAAVLGAVPGLRLLPAPDLSPAAGVLASTLPGAGAAATSVVVGASLAVTGMLVPVAAAQADVPDAIQEQVSGAGKPSGTDLTPLPRPRDPSGDDGVTAGATADQGTDVDPSDEPEQPDGSPADDGRSPLVSSASGPDSRPVTPRPDPTGPATPGRPDTSPGPPEAPGKSTSVPPAGSGTPSASPPKGPPAGVPTGPPEGVPAGPPTGRPTGPPDDVPAGPPAGRPTGPPAWAPGPPSGVPAGTPASPNGAGSAATPASGR